MSELQFHPDQAVGQRLAEMDKQELLRFVSRLCLHLKAEVGSRAFRGGIFPENICTDGEDGFALGPAKKEKWSGQELEYVAPELYWHGDASPAADVYSLALLVCYGLNEGKLPFDTPSGSGQLARMSGKPLPLPRNAGKRLTEVLEKATAFQAADRYQNPEELQIMLESCMDNKYLNGSSGAEAVFRKDAGELSEIERMMVDIIERPPEAENTEPEEPPAASEGMSPEEQAGLEKPQNPPQEKEDISAAVEEFFGGLSDQSESALLDASGDEEETIRVYEPSREKKERQPIPILTEEKYPELAPVVLQKTPPRIRREQPPEEPEETPQEEVRKRRNLRPLAVVLILCLSLVAGALGLNLYWNRDREPILINPTLKPYRSSETESSSFPSSSPTVEPTLVIIPTEAPQPLPRYSVIPSDLSWTEALAACREAGGHLAVISSQEELDEITQRAEALGLTCVWVGCHRENGELVWENEEETDFYSWAPNEPSTWDTYDNVPENYIMVYRQGDSWLYNDNRDDPAGDYPAFYSGVMGYACEFER